VSTESFGLPQGVCEDMEITSRYKNIGRDLMLVGYELMWRKRLNLTGGCPWLS
jgi:hypothetical protein